MNRQRARAYARVTRTLRDVGPAKLHPDEQACIRRVADTLLFCADLDGARERAALADLSELHDRIVDSGRWTPGRAARLIDDVWSCAPPVELGLPAAA